MYCLDMKAVMADHLALRLNNRWAILFDHYLWIIAPKVRHRVTAKHPNPFGGGKCFSVEKSHLIVRIKAICGEVDGPAWKEIETWPKWFDLRWARRNKPARATFAGRVVSGIGRTGLALVRTNRAA